jgi:serine/threonine protein kinase
MLQAVDWWSVGVLMFELLTGLSPFALNGRKNFEDDINRRILETEPPYPDHLTPAARHFIASLLIKNPEKRLGGGPDDARELKHHSFFMDEPNFNWESLEKKQIPPPFIPFISHELDTRNFSEEFTKMRITNHRSSITTAPKHKNFFRVSFLDFVYYSI